MIATKPSVSALVEEWRLLRSKCQSDLDAADFSAFDTIAELYGEQITRIERQIADADPESLDDIAAMLDVVLDSLEADAMDSDHPPLMMVRKIRNRLYMIARGFH